MLAYPTVVQRIQELANEQSRIYLNPSPHGLSAADCVRLAEIKDELQQLWLARKLGRVNFRDALEDFGEGRKFSKALPSS